MYFFVIVFEIFLYYYRPFVVDQARSDLIDKKIVQRDKKQMAEEANYQHELAKDDEICEEEMEGNHVVHCLIS